LIALLNRIDPDHDCEREEQGDNDSDEDSQNEPSLGSNDNFANQGNGRRETTFAMIGTLTLSTNTMAESGTRMASQA
jgi:hypothetical protein